MATLLPSIDSRQVVRCDRCNLTQFPSTNNLCRRCHLDLDADQPEATAPALTIMPRYGNGGSPGNGSRNLAGSIKALRLRSGLSQRQLAMKIGIPRTYVSKLETQTATPTISSLERLAKALHCTIPDLLCDRERNRQTEVGGLLKDKFLRELLPFIQKLNQAQRLVVLTHVSDLAAEASRRRVVRA